LREIDLKKYKIRTDLITDVVDHKKSKNIEEIIRYVDDIKISNITLKEDEPLINRKKGFYTTIFFNDITDNSNEKKVVDILTEELKEFLSKMNIKENDKILIIGLGNSKSTPDMLGPKVVEKIIVTSHIKKLVGSLEKGYKEVSVLSPGVMGTTGIETKDIVLGVVNEIKPDFLIFIDALSSDRLDRVNKTIQITNTGISPGSGIGNNRKELSFETLNIPVLAIGVPTVVDAITIVRDTINYMFLNFSYNIANINNPKLKFITSGSNNYLKEKNKKLDAKQKEKFLGLVGTLSDDELKKLLFEVLSPIGYNLMVTPKEIDFLMEKLVNIIATGLNKSIHNLN